MIWVGMGVTRDESRGSEVMAGVRGQRSGPHRLPVLLSPHHGHGVRAQPQVQQPDAALGLQSVLRGAKEMNYDGGGGVPSHRDDVTTSYPPNAGLRL